MSNLANMSNNILEFQDTPEWIKRNRAVSTRAKVKFIETATDDEIKDYFRVSNLPFRSWKYLYHDYKPIDGKSITKICRNERYRNLMKECWEEVMQEKSRRKYYSLYKDEKVDKRNIRTILKTYNEKVPVYREHENTGIILTLKLERAELKRFNKIQDNIEKLKQLQATAAIMNLKKCYQKATNALHNALSMNDINY